MSVLNQSGEEQVECPLCMEPLEVDDLHFYPCTCGYQICRFCWNRIREGENGLCPACRKAYPENPADFTPLSQEQVAAIKTEKKAREAKRRNKTLESRRALANVRVVQNNLVFVVGLPVRLADPEILKRQEYFGKYGKIHKVVINQSTTYAGSQGPSASAYVTYVSCADALRAIQGVNNVALDGRVLKGSLGTTKYCANFMKNQPCPKPDCMYLHELGDPKASFTKEEMHAGLHQVYERKLHTQLLSGKADEKPSINGNPSTNNNTDKGSSKDGNQSNFIPTTVVASSNINVVNSSRSKKESSNGSSSSSSKEAWPSLSSSPPDSSSRAQLSPKPNSIEKSQDSGSSESSSPTQQIIQQIQAPQPKTNGKENHTENGKIRNKENATNNQNNKKNKQTDSQKAKQKNGHSITEKETDEETHKQSQVNALFENETNQQNFLTNELDELESDRHSLLENHDLLDNNDHSLLEDDGHDLLKEVNNEALMMQRHREMMSGIESNHMMQIKNNMVNGYVVDRDSLYLGSDRQMAQKEMLLRERSRSEMMMRQGELMARHGLDHKHYMPNNSIGLDSTSDLLGANYHPNHNMLPFGMRVDNSMPNTLPNQMSTNHLGSNSLVNNPLTSNLSANALQGNVGGNNMNHLAANCIPVNSMSATVMGGSMINNMSGNSMAPFMMHSQQLLQQSQQMQQNAMVNGFDGLQNGSEGRYLAENMDKFFTDFHKAQQLRLHRSPAPHPLPRNVLSAERLEMEHKQRAGAVRAAGDGDDDLDFDPFKETQKALAEMMAETEMMQGNVNSGDSMDRGRRARLPPPGFGHAGFGPRAHTHQQPQTAGYPTGAASYSDWTQMDPAIMSTSVSYNKPPHDLLATFAQLNTNKMSTSNNSGSTNNGALWSGANSLWANGRVPPGFAPPKPECIDAK